MPKLAMYYITPAPGSEYLQHTHWTYSNSLH
jgi:hypothetical protein